MIRNFEQIKQNQDDLKKLLLTVISNQAEVGKANICPALQLIPIKTEEDLTKLEQELEDETKFNSLVIYRITINFCAISLRSME